MRVLILGSGGREHALAWKIAQSDRLTALYMAPGNPGMASLGTCLAIDPNDFVALKQTVLAQAIDMVVVGPEEPLVRGIYDFFKADAQLSHIPVIGPSQQAAALEGSKDFAKQFMQRHGIPTARYQSFTHSTLAEGLAFLESMQAPYVLKADGLAAGKGVLILDSLDEAKEELKEMLGGKFGASSQRVVIEEFLSGIEVSVFVLTDGQHYHLLPEAKDYKRIGNNDTGLNTGGMGSVSPVPFAQGEFMQKVIARIVEPTVQGLAKDGLDYKGFIFIGLIKVKGEPYVIEYNVRMGDPETESVMLRLDSDLLSLLEGVAQGKLHECECRIAPTAAASIVCVSGGYPGDYEKGYAISGVDKVQHSQVFHAGTAIQAGQLVTAGGRVLVVSSTADTLEQALQKSYASIGQIDYQGLYHRNDIGLDVLQ